MNDAIAPGVVIAPAAGLLPGRAAGTVRPGVAPGVVWLVAAALLPGPAAGQGTTRQGEAAACCY